MAGILLTVATTAALVWAGRLLAVRLMPFGNEADRWTAGFILSFAGVVVSTEVLSAFGAIGRIGILTAVGCLLAIGLAVRRPASILEPPAPVANRVLAGAGFFLVTLVAASWLWVGAASPVVIDNDGPIYHLPFAVRWLQDGTLTRTWTPFGELAATYFPGNGEIWFCWLLALVGDDRLAKVGQWIFLAPTAMALASLGRSAGGDRTSSLWPGLGWCAAPFVCYYSIRPNVDLPMTFALVSGIAFLARSWRAEEARERRAFLTMAGLALGLAAGTKTIGLVFASVPMLLLIATAFRRPRGALQASAAAFLGGGYWYLKNWIDAGNPLYPYRVSFRDRVVFDGWYDADVLRATSAYHFPTQDFESVRRILLFVTPPTLGYALALSICVGLMSLTVPRRFGRAAILASLAIAISWTALFWFVQPYNSQPRFLLSALALGFVPLAVFRGAWGVVPVTLLSTAAVQQVWPLADIDWRFDIVAAGVLSAAIVMLRSTPNRTSHAPMVGGVAILALFFAPTIWQPRSERFRELYFPSREFGAKMFGAWTALQAAVDAAPRDRPPVVGYAGTNLPYFLAGAAQRNHVRYVNVQGEASWLPHDHFRARRREVSLPPIETAFPQWYRDRPNKETWLRNLDALRVDDFVVARENFHGRKDAPESPPFPIEYTWLTSTPERFERLGPPMSPDGVEPWAIAFRVKPAVAPPAKTRTN